MVTSLTGMEIANASLLDEGTAAAEAMVMAFVSAKSPKKNTFFVDAGVLPQTLTVLRTRAKGFGIELIVGDATAELKQHAHKLCGALVQYPNVNGAITDFGEVTDTIHKAGGLLAVASDLLALTMLKPPGEWGADVVLGNSAHFGVPMGYGGPHAAFFATTDKLKRKLPGRIVGRSKDVTGKLAYRLALQSEWTGQPWLKQQLMDVTSS
jgi:glycine dehydrogenase